MRTPVLILLARSAARAAGSRATPRVKRAAITLLSKDPPRLALGRIGLVRMSDVAAAVKDIDRMQTDEGLLSGQCTAYGVLTLLDYQYGLRK